MKYIILLGAFQAMVVFTIFLMDHKKRSSDTILSWFLILVFVHLGVGFLLHTLFPNAEIHKQFYTFITLIYAPLLWIYTTHLSGRNLHAGRKNYYHFLPAMAGAIVYFIIAGYIIAHDGSTPTAIIYYNMVGNGIFLQNWLSSTGTINALSIFSIDRKKTFYPLVMIRS